MTLVALFVPIFSCAFLFATVAFAVWTSSRARTERARYQAEVQTKLIDRFSSAPELVEFLKTAEGRQFVGEIESGPRLLASDRILGGIRRGIVLALLGLGFLAVWLIDTNNIGFAIPGWILLALGIGYFVATYVSLRLSRSWGLLPDRKEPTLP